MPNTKLLYPILALAILAIFGGVGYLASKNQTEQSGKPVTPNPAETTQPSTPAPPQTTQISADPTADWQTYENKEYGFSFKYPKNWTAQAVGSVNETIIFRVQLYLTGEQAQLEGGLTGDILVGVLRNNKKLTLKDFYDEKNNQVNLYKDARKGTKIITVDGKGSTRFEGVVGFLGDYTIVAVPYDEVIIEITDQGEIHQEDGVFDQILSTFQFTK